MPQIASAPLNLLPVAPTFFSWRGHQIAWYQDGSGPPALLVHSINAAASAFEMRAPFRDLASDHTVYALDLLGYGESDRPARRYQASDYIDLIGAALRRIGEPTVLIASSLGAAYAIAAATIDPELVRALVLVCPVGISQLASPPGPGQRAFYRLLRGPLGRSLFRALTTRGGTRYFLRQQAYASEASLTEETIDGFYRSSQRPGALYAPICFLSSMLNCQIGPQFAQLSQPILIVWGRQATTTPVTKADEFLARNHRAQLVVIDEASLIVQDEQPAEFARRVRLFLV